MRARVLYVHARKIFSPRFPEKKKRQSSRKTHAARAETNALVPPSLSLFFLILFSSLPVAPKKKLRPRSSTDFPEYCIAKRERRLGLSVDEVVNQQFNRDLHRKVHSRARVKLIASCHWQPFCETRNECGFLAENAGSVRERTRRVATFRP